MFRALLLACMAGVLLSACANDGRLDLKKLDLPRLKQPDWFSWEKNKQPQQTASPASEQNTAGAPAAPEAADQKTAKTRTAIPGLPVTPAIAQGLPRPKPWRPVQAQTGIAQTAYRQKQPNEAKEQPAKAPQGKVTSTASEVLAALPPPGKGLGADRKGGYSPNDLIGLDGPSVERFLGKPDLSRKEPFAEVWQYAHGDCVLFLFIYAEDGGVARVSHAETSARDGGDDPEPGKCIGAILARNSATPG